MRILMDIVMFKEFVNLFRINNGLSTVLKI